MTQSSETSVRTVAYIGVGRMGGPMAANAMARGFAVTAYDPSQAAVAALAARGARGAGSIAEAVAGADAVVTMLPTDEALSAVAEGPGGLLASLAPGQIAIDMSTSKLASSVRIAEALAERGVAMLDAPVSGGVSGAEQGTLSIMVGGERAVFERCQALLASMGTTVTYIGPSGHGLIAKLVNQMLMEATFCAVAESFGLVARAGADFEAVYEAVRGGLGGSRVLDLMMPHLLTGELGDGRELTLHYKDGAYALAAAESLGAWVPLTELTHQLYQQAMDLGAGGGHASGVARVFEQKIGARLVGAKRYQD
jgi:2-hydroxy-3-oxopropionate reductase